MATLENRLRMMEDRLIRAKETKEIEQMQLVVSALRKKLSKTERSEKYGLQYR